MGKCVVQRRKKVQSGWTYYFHDMRKEKRIASRRQQGGCGVMVWAGFCSRGKTPICFMKGKQDSKCYQNLLSDNLLPLWTQGDKLLQGDAPIHVSEYTIKF